MLAKLAPLALLALPAPTGCAGTTGRAGQAGQAGPSGAGQTGPAGAGHASSRKLMFWSQWDSLDRSPRTKPKEHRNQNKVAAPTTRKGGPSSCLGPMTEHRLWKGLSPGPPPDWLSPRKPQISLPGAPDSPDLQQGGEAPREGMAIPASSVGEGEERSPRWHGRKRGNPPGP